MLQTHIQQKQVIVAFSIGKIDFTNSMLPNNMSFAITPYIIFIVRKKEHVNYSYWIWHVD